MKMYLRKFVESKSQIGLQIIMFVSLSVSYTILSECQLQRYNRYLLANKIGTN